jgi:hypothetical protein
MHYLFSYSKYNFNYGSFPNVGRDLFLFLPCSAQVKNELTFTSTPACDVTCNCRDNVLLFHLFFVYNMWMCVCCPSLKLFVWHSHLFNTFSYILHNYFSSQNIQHFVEMCLQLAMENCQWPGRNTNVTVIELTNHHNLETLTSHLKTLVPYYLQVKGIL